jgi:hypothetical protein
MFILLKSSVLIINKYLFICSLFYNAFSVTETV